ncbi:FAD-dependent oxidoreductase [Bradyrhizobium sp. Leo121]|uniref:FAD-dependent oxidoreductase n=1 Tax=Bradyrhizobium sp. Leo121 TaxID=1571195 RepID=UPI00102A1501|nr:FAD-dependent oxidoreductase [Bradyrhizobium sp. Leo121]RZN31437.1 FAD-monooxygenase [Bradyrhizobium sp. Leo121]
MRASGQGREADVLIVGAGPVGLALAVELGERGVDVIIVEQNDRGGRQPRAKTTNVRSMQLLRRWGIAEAIRKAGPLPPDYPSDIVFATRLFGRPLAKFENVFFGYREKDPKFPESAQWIPQYAVEACLREHLGKLPGVTLKFGARLDDLAQDADGATATVMDIGSKQPFSVRARYVVGADGGRSRVRSLLTIRMVGDHAYMGNYLAIFRAPGLTGGHPQDKAISYWLVNPDCPAVIGPMDRGDTWFFSTQLPNGAIPYDPKQAREKITQALGREIEFEILETDTWSAHKLVAERYSDGRILLAGDACHLHPPMGGYGMNMGIGDAVDLGWKIAAVVKGWGGEVLLDSYEVERKPVHQKVISEAAHNYSFVTYHMVNESLETEGPVGEAVRQDVGRRILETKAREFKAIGVVLGYHYDGSPIIVADGTSPPHDDPMQLTPSARPGGLAPHWWMEDGSSLFDHFGPDFTLLVLDPAAAPHAAVIENAADTLGIPLKRLDLAQRELATLYAARLVLVRPDQHVAWRADRLQGDARDILKQITGHTGLASATKIARSGDWHGVV